MINITWGNLMPPRCSQAYIVNFLLAPSFFNNPDLGKSIQESSFYQRKDGTILDALNNVKAFRSRLFNFGDSPKTSEKLINLLLLKTKQDNIAYTLDTFPIRHEFKKQWKFFLKEYFGDQYSIYLEDYKKYINLFLEDNYTIEDFEAEADTDFFKRVKSDRRDFQKNKITIPYHGNEIPLGKLLHSIEAADYSKSPFLDERNSSDISSEDNLFFERLSTLSILACVWIIFAKVEEKENKQITSERKDKKNVYAELIVRLAPMIFPTETVNTLFYTTPENDGSDFIADTFEIPSEKTDTAEARKMLAPVPGYINAKAFTEAGELCEQVFQSYKYASDPVMAETLTYLHTCCVNGYPVPKAFSSIEDIEKQAYYYGSIYSSQKRNDIKAAPVPSKTVTSGFFTANCKNKIYDWIEKTKPESWKSSVSSVPESAILPHVHQRMLLIHDDFDLNLQDALNVLDRIKKNIATEKETTISDWKNFELYIRCDEAEATPILDTALSYFTENNEIRSSADFSLIKIYLIDEAKRSADYLFARHPLFYPLTLPKRNANEIEKVQNMHLVIFSDNPDHNYAKWLIKEAFWTLPHLCEKINTKISLISPHASEIADSILLDCPGLADFSYHVNRNKSYADTDNESKNIQIDDIPFPEIWYQDTSFSSRSILNTLKDISSSNDYLYFVVDSVSDVGSIKLATRIRELTIRKSVLDGRINSYSKKNFIIAVHCTDPDYAGLSKDLIIPKETEHANKWFNNYNFIPFASIADLYSWDQLNGGVIEEISQCVHLQYCQSSQQKDACYENLKSYFERLYNRDSSFSAAVSMPYRLFEAGITPTPDWSSWDIQDPDAWWNPETRSHMAETYLEKLTDTSVTDAKNEHPSFHQDLVEQLAKYEQMRWCCYQLTRGWLPVEPSQVLQYINSGVSRHTLQIAKLHPCICSWNDLKTLQEILSDEAKREICTSKNIDTLSKEELIPLLNPKFAKYFSYEKDYSYFQKLNYENIEKTADILTNQWHTDQAF